MLCHPAAVTCIVTDGSPSWLGVGRGSLYTSLKKRGREMHMRGGEGRGGEGRGMEGSLRTRLKVISFQARELQKKR